MSVCGSQHSLGVILPAADDQQVPAGLAEAVPGKEFLPAQLVELGGGLPHVLRLYRIP
jgi:hypothetical protein